MSKLVIIGDVHGRGAWKDIVRDNPDADLFVFLGDYVSTHEGISECDQLSNLFEILSFKEAHPDKVILLRGNHDIQHLGYYWAECSGFFRSVEEEMSKEEVRERYLRDTQWVYVKDGVVFSHAGISERWFRDSRCGRIEDINDLEPSELFGFRPCKMSDYYGISETQGPTWIRPQTLIEYALPGYTYVVGHTPQPTICNLTELVREKAKEDESLNDFIKEDTPDIWLCDCLPNEYLIIKDNEFIPTKL